MKYKSVVKFNTKTDAWLTWLALSYLAIYSFQVLLNPENPWQVGLEIASDVIYIAFAVDFALRIVEYALTPSKEKSLRRFIASNFISALALIAPAWRSLRVFRLILLLRGFSSLAGNKAESTGLMVLVAFPLIAYSSALAILDAESQSPDANITSLKDGLWWALTTMTTVGYGDRYPTTDEGRLIASALLIVGILTFSSLTALVSNWIITSNKTKN